MARLYDENGRQYIDFFAGAGALNYGHNNDYIKSRILEYFQNDGVTHALDMYTNAQKNFLEAFEEKILKPRNLNYKVQFCGPTGANSVEAALKLARKAKGRSGIFAFTGSFHGMTMGSSSVTSNTDYQKVIGTQMTGVTFMPFPFGFYESFDTISYIEEVLKDPNSGVAKPAAIILETVQCDGGICVAPEDWLVRLRALCDAYDVLLIVDDVQAGCGRTGNFFSFERAGIVPDIVTVSKSISGYGLPMAIVLIKPELDVWAPGEHTGTFRGFQPAYVGAAAALEYREIADIDNETRRKGAIAYKYLKENVETLSDAIDVRGLGLLYGIDCHDTRLSKAVVAECFKNGLIIERTGRNDEVVKFLPPLIIPEEDMMAGLKILRDAVAKCV
jgi:diaminobutyrate-2-oxoglutarate transaminase